ncbi:FAD-dependent oxidoreductase [Escherichia coli]
MAKAIDQAGIQFRILNASKGPAVRTATRVRRIVCSTVRRYVRRWRTNRT